MSLPDHDPATLPQIDSVEVLLLPSDSETVPRKPPIPGRVLARFDGEQAQHGATLSWSLCRQARPGTYARVRTLLLDLSLDLREPFLLLGCALVEQWGTGDDQWVDSGNTTLGAVGDTQLRHSRSLASDQTWGPRALQ
ncbi:MAG: hypothetical protein KIT58_05930 [Planctomycetota bacterium]|nr:hypothetical protein [Planctomycetota bacterium]